MNSNRIQTVKLKKTIDPDHLKKTSFLFFTIFPGCGLANSQPLCSVGSAFCMEGGFHTFKVSQAKIWPNLNGPNLKCFFEDFWSIWCLWICIIVAFILGVDCNRMGIWWWQISSWHWTNVSNKVSPILQILLPIFYSHHHYGEFFQIWSDPNPTLTYTPGLVIYASNGNSGPWNLLKLLF